MITNIKHSQQQKLFIVIALLSLVLLTKVSSQEVIPSRNKDKVKFAFGSCNKFTEDQESEIFSKIELQNPDSFAWLGDAAYVDVRQFVHFWSPDPSVEQIKKKFDNVIEDQYYQQFVKSGPKIIGVWDDHDYNMNDGGRDFEGKYKMQQLYLDFLNEPSDSPRRTNKQGIYVSYYLGEEKRIKVILLDVRFNRDHRRDPNPTEMLGETQWKWLENELSDKGVLLNLIASGTQVIPDDRFLQEQWFNQSRQRLLTLLKDKKAPTLLLSGDIHQAEIMSMPCSEQYLGYVLREVTSSGLSFTNAEMTNLFPFFRDIVKLGVPPTFSTHEFDRYLERNYGMINVEWNNTDILNSVVQLHIYGNKTLTPVLAQEYRLYEFQYNPDYVKEVIKCPTYDLSPGQRKAQNYLNLLKQYDVPAIIVTLIGGIILMNIFKIVKVILFTCCKGFYSAQQRQNKLKTE